MTLAKATVTGKVFRQPEQRYTQNDVEVWSFTLNVDAQEETLVRVVSKRRTLSDVLRSVKVGDRLLVDGRLQVSSFKTSEGADRKYFEIDANDIELLGASDKNTSVPSVDSADVSLKSVEKEEIVTFAETDFSEENLLDDEEVPF